MIEIPENNSAELEAKQKAAHDAEIDMIVAQFMEGLKTHIQSTVECQEHMIGYMGSKKYHHLCDTKEAARRFKEKGYYCYYYDGYNNHGVNQRAVCVRKTPMSDSDMQCARNWSWIRL